MVLRVCRPWSKSMVREGVDHGGTSDHAASKTCHHTFQKSLGIQEVLVRKFGFSSRPPKKTPNEEKLSKISRKSSILTLFLGRGRTQFYGQTILFVDIWAFLNTFSSHIFGRGRVYRQTDQTQWGRAASFVHQELSMLDHVISPLDRERVCTHSFEISQRAGEKIRYGRSKTLRRGLRYACFCRQKS